jgi:hypothetical protein
MKNTIIKHDIREVDEFKYSDYTSRNFRTILTMPELSDTTYFDYLISGVDQTVEQISYELYGTADYWDLLILINDRDPLFDIPYNFDVLSELARKKIEKYTAKYSGNFDQTNIDVLEARVLSNLEASSDKFKTWKIFRKDKLYDFLTIYRGMNNNV